MLLHLTIKNYALIHHLGIDFSENLNVITGETGTGKSIMLGALGLLMGNRADGKMLQDKNKKCIVEGTFEIGDYKLKPLFEETNLDHDNTTIIRREIAPGGKSRAFINDTPVTLEVMKKVSGQLMNIHSQHDIIGLKNHAFQLKVVDLYAANQSHRQAYKIAWKRFVTAKKAHADMMEDANKIRQEADFVAYQLNELTEANLDEAEQEQLESELKVMENAKEIKAALNTALYKLNGAEVSADTIVTEVQSLLNSLSDYSEKYAALYRRVESLRIELRDIVDEVMQEDNQVDCESEKIDDTKERLDLIYKLLHKHKCNTTAQLLLLKESLQDKANQNTELESSLASAKQAAQEAEIRLEHTAKKLSQSRTGVFKPFCNRIVRLLQELGIPHAKLKVAHQQEQAGSTGTDNINLLFSANKGVEERSLAQVASGGEFSRLMFCIRYVLAKKAALATLVLDEIDTGISGETAIQLGDMMKIMATQCQLIAISHLPQIAAKADRHFYVYKQTKNGKTISTVKLLDDKERITEIAKMISGNRPPAAATESARALMQGRSKTASSSLP